MDRDFIQVELHYKNTSIGNIEGEVWLPVKGWEALYMVSNKGRVKSLDRYTNHWQGGKILVRGKILRQFTRKGYLNVNLCVQWSRLCANVHRLVCESFHENPENLPVINHNDLNKLNNNSGNVHWCTVSSNTQHAWDNGAFNNSRLYLRNR